MKLAIIPVCRIHDIPKVWNDKEKQFLCFQCYMEGDKQLPK